MTLPLPLEDRLFAPSRAVRADIAHRALPAPLRPGARLSILDISEYFSATGGGVRTYLTQKARFVEGRPDLRQVLVVPGEADAISQGDGVRCYRLQGPAIPFNANYRLMLATRSTRRIVAHERPDVIEVGSAYFAPWLIRQARRRHDAPAVWFYHAHLPRIVAPAGAAHAAPVRAAAAAVTAYVRRVARMAACTIVASRFVRDELSRIGVERLAVVPLGVDLERFHPRRRAWADATRARHGLPADVPIALFAGRFAREKRLDVALAAWRAVHAETGALLVLVGHGPQRERLAAMGGAGVRFVPFLRDAEAMADLHAAADLYLAAGPVETFGLAALEAMASGTPVVSVASGGVPELVAAAGAGALYPNGDAAACAAAVRTVLEAGPVCGARARTYAAARHGWPMAFARLLEVYDAVRR